MVTINFDASQVDPIDHFEVIPAGLYPVMITESVEEQNKAGTGSYIKLTLTVMDGEYKGRQL